MSDHNFLDNYVLEGEKLPVLLYPSPILNKKSSPVDLFNDELKNFCKNMLYTMYLAPGIGLAAPQVGLSQRIFVIDIDFERKEVLDSQGEVSHQLYNFQPMIFINPKIIPLDEETILYEEGCLSVPGIYEKVKRYNHIKVEYQDLLGNPQVLEAHETLAVCIQHENDHLDGIVFIERLSTLKKEIYKKKFKKKK